MVRDQEVVGSNPVTPTRKKSRQRPTLFCVAGFEQGASKQKFACLPVGKKTVRWTVLRVWSPQSENPVTPTRNKKKVETTHFLFVCVAKATRFEPRFNPLAGDGNPFVNFRLTFPLIGESPVTPTRNNSVNFQRFTGFFFFKLSISFVKGELFIKTYR